MSKAQKEAVKNMKPSAYRSMLMGKLNMTNTSLKNKKDLLRWGSPTKGEKWVNLTSYLIDGKNNTPCGTKTKKQIEMNLPSVCRPSVKVDEKTPKLAKEFTKKQIEEAIKIKIRNERINWIKL
jgi:hypothetical protein